MPAGKLTREWYKRVSAAQQTRMELRVERSMRRYFDEVVASAVRELRRFGIPEGDPVTAARRLANQIVDTDESKLVGIATPVLLGLFVVGARSEEELTKATKRTTAEEIAERLEIDVPDSIAIGPFPSWLIAAANEALTDTMRQPYWMDIPKTTREDIAATLRQGIEDGLSIRRMAELIMKVHGDAYTRARATNVARTESTSMLNAGHSASIAQLEDESGLPMGKEWVSVLGNTTRASHAAMDGKQTESSEGKFVLSGVETPWPGHHALPAGERCNCQCTIISSFNVAELFGA